MTAPEPYTADALWSAGEVREQSEQVPGQLDVWDVLAECDCRCHTPGTMLHASGLCSCEDCPGRVFCDACNAEPGEPCNVGCIGEAAQSELDTTSSASRQHYIDTGEYLPQAEQ